MFRRSIFSAVLFVFLVSSTLGPNGAYAQGVFLPVPGTLVPTSSAYVPALLRGVTVHTDDPFLFDFVVDTGNSGSQSGPVDAAGIKSEAQRMIEYFLASLTIAEKDQWVNLSPYEKDRMLTEELGKTGLGRDMLAQDYVLKQVTASMIYPGKEMGKAFWQRVYERARAEYGVADVNILTDTFNKVWIVADRAAVYVHKDPKKAGQLTAVVTDAHLNVLLEGDYLAMTKEAVPARVSEGRALTPDMTQELVREIVLPELEKEVNTGRNFSNLRQIYQAVILATWYKRNLKDAILTQVYADKKKTNGIEGAWVADKKAEVDPEQIWNRYVESYKKGAFNLIKEDIDQATGETVPRKYFSGGARLIPEKIEAGDMASVTSVSGRALVVRTTMEEAVVSTLDAQQLKLLNGAEQQIAAILKDQYDRGVISEKIYNDALKVTYRNLNEWTTDPSIFRIDPSIREANLEAMRTERWSHIIEAYRQDVPFGTAGIRGKAVLTKDELSVFAEGGPFAKFLKGPNTINMVRLLKMNAGVLDNMKAKGQRVVMIGYDSRIGGDVFAEMIARLAIHKSDEQHQFKIYFFDRVAPFPEISYAITQTVLRETHGRLKKDYFSAGDDWQDVFQKLLEHGWARKTDQDTEVALTIDLEKDKDRLEEVFGKRRLQWEVIPAILVGARGIFLSASHNPADYNGDKMVDETGAQLNQVAKDETVAAINAVKNEDMKLAESLADAKPGQIVWLSAKDPVSGKNYYGFERFDLQSLYMEQLTRQVENPRLLADQAPGFRIGYGAFNGAGAELAPALLRRLGVAGSHLLVVEKMQAADGRYPLFAYGEQPDPGDPIAATLLRRELIKEFGEPAFKALDMMLGTDPDDDRLGVTVPIPYDQQKWFGAYRLLSANDAWTLALWNILNTKKQIGKLDHPDEHTFITTHVTTDALEAVGGLFGVKPSGKLLDMRNQPPVNNPYQLKLARVWTGFTYLGETARQLQKGGKVFPDFMAEESNGVSKGGHTLEKDGNLAIIFLLEVLAYAKSQGLTVFELLDRIYALIGHYATANKPLPRTGSFEGVAGFSEKIKIIKMTQEWAKMANERAGTVEPFIVAGREVTGAVEFKSGRIDEKHYFGVPDEGVRFFFKDPTLSLGALPTDSKNYLTIRTSGTSQTLRFYVQEYTGAYDPETKARNYQRAEQIALMAQMQILHDTGLSSKYGAMIVRQLMELQYTPLEREIDNPELVLPAAHLQGMVVTSRENDNVYLFGNGWELRVDKTSPQGAQGKINVSLRPGAGQSERKAAFMQFSNINEALAEGLKDMATPIAEKIASDNQALAEVLKALAIRVDGELPVKVRNDPVQGGIDFNTSKALNEQGDAVDLRLDPSALQRWRQGDFLGVTPVITRIIAVQGWNAILGI